MFVTNGSAHERAQRASTSLLGFGSLVVSKTSQIDVVPCRCVTTVRRNSSRHTASLSSLSPRTRSARTSHAKNLHDTLLANKHTKLLRVRAAPYTTGA